MEPEKADTAHLTALAEHLAKVRRHVAFLMRGRRDSVDDCVQEVMLQAFQSAHRNGPPQYPKPWLARITEHVVYRHMAGAQRRRIVEGSVEPNRSATGSALDIIVHADEESRVRDALCSLPEHDRSAIEQHYWQGRSCNAIARDAGTSTDAIKTRLLRGRSKLKRTLNSAEQERSP